MTPISLDQLQAQLEALIIAGVTTSAVPEVMTVWGQVRAQQPQAWREMCTQVVADPHHDLLRALCRQCDEMWGCRVPLDPDLAAEVAPLLGRE